MNFIFNNSTTEQALEIVHERLKTAQLNDKKNVIAATMGGKWKAVAYKGAEGWCNATMAQQAVDLPANQFPPIPPTALEIYCQLRGWAGGTIHQAVEDLRSQGRSFRERLLDELPRAEYDTMGVDALLSA
jgi:hypothetical protein